MTPRVRYSPSRLEQKELSRRPEEDRRPPSTTDTRLDHLLATALPRGATHTHTHTHMYKYSP